MNLKPNESNVSQQQLLFCCVFVSPSLLSVLNLNFEFRNVFFPQKCYLRAGL